MAVDPDHAAGRLMYDGTAYYFCTLACAGTFAQQPERFVGSHLTRRLSCRVRSERPQRPRGPVLK